MRENAWDRKQVDSGFSHICGKDAELRTCGTQGVQPCPRCLWPDFPFHLLTYLALFEQISLAALLVRALVCFVTSIRLTQCLAHSGPSIHSERMKEWVSEQMNESMHRCRIPPCLLFQQHTDTKIFSSSLACSCACLAGNQTPEHGPRSCTLSQSTRLAGVLTARSPHLCPWATCILWVSSEP